MKKICYLLSCLTMIHVTAQTHDSISEFDAIELNPTVISGQYNRQSVKNSIYEVKVINRDMIDRLAGSNLADVLNQTLNINIVGNSSTGKSTVKMFGLDGKYFKILVDNIPLLNDEGLGNNTDLTQINLDDIEQIEIVEGSMGVDYGANAIAGIVNIITKKDARYKTTINAFVQEETIGDEYNLTNKGRHIQSLKIGHKLSPKLYTELNFQRNDFKGFWDENLGKHHHLNDDRRGYEWLPKKQNSSKFLIRYRKPHYQLFYRFEYFNEQTDFYNPIVNEQFQPSTGTYNPIARDTRYTTDRIYNLLNASGRLNDLFNYDFSFSYQNQKRKQKNYQYEILTEQESEVQKSTYESRDGYYSRGMISNFIKKENIDFQVGYEVSYLTGYAAQRKDVYQTPIDRKLGSYDFFASSEISFSPQFSIRPGYRIMFSNLFDTQHVASLSTRVELPNDFEIRLIAGTAPRNPNFDELYTYLVDVNHDLRGNENLKPETGLSAFLHLKKNWKINENLRFQNKLSLWKISLKDKIELVTVNDAPLQYSYMNVDHYDTQGITYINDFKFKNFLLGAGATLTGIKQDLDDELNADEKYLYTLNLNAQAAWNIPNINTTLSLFYRYNGEQELYTMKTNENGDAYYAKGVQEAYSWLDASIKKSFWDNRFELTFGARNILDVKSIKNTTESVSGHTEASSNMMLGYGRSFFLKFLYNLKLN